MGGTCSTYGEVSGVHKDLVVKKRDHLELFGEVNSVKKHNYKIWLNDGVY